MAKECCKRICSYRGWISKVIIPFSVIIAIHPYCVACVAADNNQNQSHQNLHMKSTGNLSSGTKDEDFDLDKWEAPIEFRRNFAYYLSGFDDENRPIWVAELGRWDIRKVMEEGKGPIMEKYIDQILYRFNNSISERSSNNAEPVTGGIAIVDMEEYSWSQVASIPTLRLMIKKASDVAAFAQRMEEGYFVNTNFIAQSFINLVRPIMSSVLSRVEVYGTNKEQWIPQLLKSIPRESIPEWYGGPKNFTPVRVYG